jgi:hypothetical protein
MMIVFVAVIVMFVMMLVVVGLTARFVRKFVGRVMVFACLAARI